MLKKEELFKKFLKIYNFIFIYIVCCIIIFFISRVVDIVWCFIFFDVYMFYFL